jgi:hypothetical protein
MCFTITMSPARVLPEHSSSHIPVYVKCHGDPAHHSKDTRIECAQEDGEGTRINRARGFGTVKEPEKA